MHDQWQWLLLHDLRHVIQHHSSSTADQNCRFELFVSVQTLRDVANYSLKREKQMVSSQFVQKQAH